MAIHLLDHRIAFPDPREATEDGVLALGGDLDPRRIVAAYARGIFPWPVSGMLAWFSPDPRMVLQWPNLRVSRSLRKVLRDGAFTVTFDQAFERVIAACATIERVGQPGTWITRGMREAYAELHDLGFAHSVEVWRGRELVGGLYGVSIGTMFCGESMFHHATDASKVAFVTLARQLEAWGFAFLDCQLHTDHLASLGAQTMPRDAFLAALAEAVVGARTGDR